MSGISDKNMEVLKNLLPSQKMKENEMGKTCSTVEQMRNAYKIFVRKSQGKIPLKRTKCR
jgi:hypothetical protein